MLDRFFSLYKFEKPRALLTIFPRALDILLSRQPSPKTPFKLGRFESERNAFGRIRLGTRTRKRNLQIIKSDVVGENIENTRAENTFSRLRHKTGE